MEHVFRSLLVPPPHPRHSRGLFGRFAPLRPEFGHRAAAPRARWRRWKGNASVQLKRKMTMDESVPPSCPASQLPLALVLAFVSVLVLVLVLVLALVSVLALVLMLVFVFLLVLVLVLVLALLGYGS